ncbi:MAG: outer membrane beta-barrel protein [Paludibacteraceae bacterium]|jgi:hypothetical protein|nr:outer membrane beta-barrel protein [Paludibacteraceae bacterium]
MRRHILSALVVLATVTAYAGQLHVGLEAGYDFAHLRSFFVTTEQNASKQESTTVSHVIYQHDKVIETYDEVDINGRTQKQDKNITATYRLPQMHGFHVGPTFDYRFTKIPSLGLRFGAQFVFLATGGLIFDTKKERDERISEYKKSYESSSYVTQLYRIQLPLRLSYTFKLKKDTELWLMTGPKFNIGIAMVTDDVRFSRTNDVDYKVHTDYYSGRITITDHGVKSYAELDWENKYIPFDASWGFGIGFSYKDFSVCAVYDLGISDMGGYQKYSNTDLKLDYKALTYINQLQVVLSYTFKAKTKK